MKLTFKEIKIGKTSEYNGITPYMMKNICIKGIIKLSRHIWNKKME